MDVKIGIATSGREVSVSVTETPDELEQRVLAAMADRKPLIVVDDKGRRVVVPVEQLAYVEIGPADGRRVGFAIGG